ncbi:hypothetical protein PROFUN_09884 [Planoprotostelium fungivorum]|uniref:Uncharacterized protein n=1 Tax=Planoprotostelium fungivorum TaxID=1890364 RepID=A0A2P6NGG3_9EUKA|nr:hypothetical protein PROFUN_09884 [Planoprotostelium fungivorum]
MTANLDKKFPIEKEFSTTLLASAEYIGKPCDRANREFLWCKMKNDNPEKCLSQGEDTLQCATDVLGTLKSNCGIDLHNFATCLNLHSYRVKECRVQQRDLRRCATKFYPEDDE